VLRKFSCWDQIRFVYSIQQVSSHLAFVEGPHTVAGMLVIGVSAISAAATHAAATGAEATGVAATGVAATGAAATGAAATFKAEVARHGSPQLWQC
jgi:hypothetical protein